MTEPRRPAIFIADALGLDFLNSLAVPVDVPVEWLTSGDDLLAWLKQANMVPGHVLESMERAAVPGELDGVAAQARALREWFRGFVHKHKGRSLGAEALEELAPLNQILAREEAYGQVVLRNGNSHDHHDHGEHETAPHSGLAWHVMRRWRSPESLLLPVARAMAELICEEDFSHVKQCEGPACTLLFIDKSYGNSRRRWCSMAVCGNRAKQLAHRERKNQAKK
jgi:predicted RNA-binding Zn ribbon-like protein